MRPLPATVRAVRWVRGFGPGLGLVVVAVLAYANSLSAPFVYDDLLAIPQNPSIRRLWPLTEVLFPRVDGGVTVSGRPVLNLSFALNHAVSGSGVWSYHLVNLLLHAGSGLLLYGLVRRTLARLGAARPTERDGGRLALLIAAIWTAHPLHTQAVTYTVQRAEGLMAFFALGTLYAFGRSAGEDPPGRRRAWAAASVAACALGMGTKEVMATVPLLVLLYDRTFLSGTWVAAWHARGRTHLALAATWLVLAALLWTTGGNRGGTVGLGVGVPLWAYPLTQFKAIATYLARAIWPEPLVFEYGTFWVRHAGDVLPAAALVLPLLGATALALWRWPRAGFLGTWFFLILAPTSLAPGTLQMIVEHRMYLPLASVVAGLAWGLHRLIGRRTWGVGTVLVAALLVLTVRRNHDYRSALALWGDTVAKRPDNPRAHEGLAEALAAAGRFDEAIRVRQESVRLLPDESQYHYNLAVTLAEAGRAEEAIRHYRLSLRLYPTEARTHNNLAILLARQGRPAEALPHYAEAVRLRPTEALYHYNYGVAQLRAGQFDGAATSFQESLRHDPGRADSHYNLGAALLRLNRLPAALEHYAAAARLRPDDSEYGAGLGNALLTASRAADALAAFDAVLARHPDATEARFGAGSACADLRRYAEAMAHFEAVLQRAPQHPHAHFKLGNALLDTDRVAEAIPPYQAALRLNPADADIHHNLGIAYARLERWDEARRAFDEALRLKPDYADARRSREQLRQVTGR